MSKLQQRVDDYKHVFGSDAGKRVLEDLMSEAGYRSPSFRPNEDTSGRLMAFREGQRNLISYILTNLEMPREQLEKMLQHDFAIDE